MNLKEIKELIQMVSESGIDQFEYEDDDISVKVGKNETKVVTAGVAPAAAPVAAAPTIAPAVAEEPVLDGTPVTAPLVGTFYAAPSEGADPFVKVGDKVSKGDVIGIVEAMKLMNEVESEVDGTVVAIVAENGEMVEYGQPLILVK